MKIRNVVLGSVLVLSSLAAQSQQATESNQGQVAPPATVTGSGTSNYIPMWTGSSTLGNSKLYQTGGKIGVATTTPAVQLDVSGRINVSKNYSIGQAVVLAIPLSALNLAVGYQALLSDTTGEGDTATGLGALQFNTTGSGNTATGDDALNVTTTGSYNTANGYLAIGHSKAGDGNTAAGSFSLLNTTGAYNVATGYGAMGGNTSGGYNTASGPYALDNNTTGYDNIAIGYYAANNVSGGSNYNIHVGNMGVSTDNGTIRIGDPTLQTSFFVAGVRSVTTGLNDAVPVVIDSNGQLGTVSSSRRFKEDILDMGEASEGLMRLRPVTFKYQKPFTDGSKPTQYGLIAEEVAEVYPDLVAHSADGQIETVKYQVLDSMLLNEVQRQRVTVEQQQAEIKGLQQRLAKIEAALASTSRALVVSSFSMAAPGQAPPRNQSAPPPATVTRSDTSNSECTLKLRQGKW
jgi:Chaperone of endosialidase